MIKRIFGFLGLLILLVNLSSCNFVAPHVHSYGEWHLEKEATCNSYGEEKRECSCGDTQTRKLEKTDHKLVIDEEVKPTCTTTGLSSGSHCKVCGEVVEPQTVIDKLEHHYVQAEGIDATCVKEGMVGKIYCEFCGDVLEEAKVIEKRPHVIIMQEPVDATCTHTGLTQGEYCNECGEVFKKQEVVEKLPHIVVTTEAVEATCTHDGITSKSYCSECGGVFIEAVVIEKLDHTIHTIEGFPATCTSTGLTDKVYCEVCLEVFQEQTIIEMLPHNIVIDYGYDATKTETGLTNGSHCETCGVVIIKQEVIPVNVELDSNTKFFEYYITPNYGKLDSITGTIIYVATFGDNKVFGLYTDERTVYVYFNDKLITSNIWEETFKIGDNVTITKGTKYVTSGFHKYIVNDFNDICINSRGNEVPDYYDISSLVTTPNKLSQFQSSLVSLTGTIKRDSTKYYINVDGTDVLIYKDKMFNDIMLNILEEGTLCEVRGILGWENKPMLIPISNDFVTIINDNSVNQKKVTFDERLSLEKGPLTYGCLPSIGAPNVLVIPINLDSTKATDKLLSDIKVAFMGTETETGWESVNSYYKESSYGNLDINFNVIEEWFTPSFTKDFYDTYWDEATYTMGSGLILDEALAYYDDRIDYTQYDLNNDGFIDSVWLVYNCDVDFSGQSQTYWAYVTQSYSDTQYDGKLSYYYGFAGTDFMYNETNLNQSYDNNGLIIDSHTFIHETGHLLGLDDYYDYDSRSGINGLGYYGRDMMDFNIGDHGPISKLLLGWVTPTVVSGKGTITVNLSDFASTGDCIIVSQKDVNSIYSNYYMIELYTNKGLNKQDKPYDSDTMTCGIRVIQINAELNYVNGFVQFNNGTYQTGFKYDNSDEEKMFVEVIAQSSYNYYTNYSVDMGCLFNVNETLNNSNIYFTMTVTNLTDSNATLEITIN